MHAIKYSSTLDGAGSKTLVSFFLCLSNPRMFKMGAVIIILMRIMQWNATAQAQGNLPITEEDSFVHIQAQPVFVYSNAFLPPATRVAEVKLTDFPGFHIRRMELTLIFDRPVSAATAMEIQVANWQPFPTQYDLQWHYDQGMLVIQVIAPVNLDLRPGALLHLRWTDLSGGNSPVTKLVEVRGIVITDNINDFRQSWLPPHKWKEVKEN